MRHACLLGVLLISAGSLLLGAACGGSAATSGSGDAGPLCPDDLVNAVESEFCAKDTTPIDCDRVTSAYTSRVCSVAMIPPTKELARSSTVKEYAGTGDPQLGCYAPSGYPAKPGMSQMVQVSGIAKIFSKGCESKNLKVEIFPVMRTGGADDGNLGGLVGAAVTTAASCQADAATPPSRRRQSS